VSTAPVPEPVSEQGNKKKMPIDRNGPLRQHYTLKEMTVLVDQVLKIEPEHMKNGWKVVAAAVQKEMGTKQQRSPDGLRKKYEELSVLSCDHADLGTLVKKIRDREAADIKKKHILTSVVGRPGNIHTVMGNDEEENGDGIESKSKEDDSTPMLRRVKNSQRIRAIETNKKEREKNKEALSVLVAQSAAALAAASSSSGQGINENVAELKIEQKHLKRKVEQIENKVADLNTHVAELNTNVEGMRQEFSHGVSRIEQLITKNMRRN
jgi:outer membrane murein-binding lipoprotein Lpp